MPISGTLTSYNDSVDPLYFARECYMLEKFELDGVSGWGRAAGDCGALEGALSSR
ncbi:hypothetical protein CE91St63_13770 [[Clostridium] hylemonae]|nr:hypothetical protein CE91St63_13770 [[Clostridium] hylemonae]